MSLNKLVYLAITGVFILFTGCLLLLTKLYDLSAQKNQLKYKISLEKTIHQHQISEILKRYDSLKNLHFITAQRMSEKATNVSVLSSGE